MAAQDCTKPKKVKSYPFLVSRELAATACGLAILILFSVFLDAPLDGPADPNGIPSEGLKAPWIFVGVQQTLRWMPAEIAGVLLPVLAVLVLAFIPYPKLNPVARGMLFVGVVTAIIVLTIWGYFS